jgi:DNA polymerase
VTVRLVRDYELRSEVSVTDVGARRYACDPSTEILCVAYRVKRDAAWGPVKVAIGAGGADGRAAVEKIVTAGARENMFDFEESKWRVVTWDEYFYDFAHADVVAAHNNGFEAAIEDYLLPDVARMRAQKWETCTAARSRRLSLPGSLADACRVLRTPHQKSDAGHGVMLQCSQPRPAWTNRQSGRKWFDDSERLAKTAIYCAEDVLAECDLDDYLPELPPLERSYWLHTELVNRRGVPLDVPLIDAMSAAVAYEQQTSLATIRNATKDPEFTLTNPAAIIAFCKTRGLWLANLQKETVERTLRDHDDGTKRIDEVAKLVLEARRDTGGKTSISKLPRMRSRVMSDGRSRDNVIYHGAHTGRPTGDGINVLNLPRPYKKFDQDRVIQCVRRGDLRILQHEQGVSTSTAVSAALRGVFCPGPGRKLVVGDYSSVEPAFYFTLSQQWDAVEIIKSRGSLYIDFGYRVYNRKLDKIADLHEYTTCKETVLQCSYGAGKPNLNRHLASRGSILPQEETDKVHDAYHRLFPTIKDTWKGLEGAAKAAVREPGATFRYESIYYTSDGWWLVCVLPSGRPFYYPNARLQPGKYNDEIVYEGWRRIDGRPAGWGDVRTWGGSLLENVTQAACRDILEEDQLVVEQQPGWEVILTVYDEIVASVPVEDVNAVATMKSIMERPRAWMSAMPILAEVFEADRYVKH